MMKFSVLMSVYAKEKPEHLRESLESVFRQTLPPDEVVLVEDGPLTATLQAVVDKFAAKHETMKVVALRENIGLGRALHEGLQHCTHDLVARMDSDDVCMADRFEAQTAYFGQHPDTDVLGGWVSEFKGDTTNVLSVRKVPENHDELLRFSRKRNPMNHPAVMLRKSAVERAGSYRDCKLFEDYDLWVRLFQTGATFHNLQRPLLWFRMSDQLFNRRGGAGYIRKEIQFQWSLYRRRHIPLTRMGCNILQRTGIRLLPNRLRKNFYLFLLRR